MDQVTGERYAPKDAKDYYNVVPRHQAEICYRKALDSLARCAVAQVALLKCIDGYNRVLQRQAPTWFDRHIYDDREPLREPKRYFKDEPDDS